MSDAAALCWGVYRELAHSPGRETDDAEILRSTGQELSGLGFSVTLKSPDELPEANEFDAVPPFLFVMCEQIPVVERLAAWERRGARVVNRPSGIRNTDRERTIALFRAREVAHPRSLLVSTDQPASVAYPGPCWLKRADVHATQAGDVSFAGSPAALESHLVRLRARGIARAVVQDHVEGDLIKFYGVAGLAEDGGPPSWFQWFYHRDQILSNHSFDPDALAAATAKAAGALGLDVYGGDAIVSADGAICVIDLNAWPSFALFRPVAAARIAALLAARFVGSGVMR
jgi:glutathione synthase/RimK-type ligase-like ATP-grasp enzyme